MSPPAAAKPDQQPAKQAAIAPEVVRHIDRSVPAFPRTPWRRRLLLVVRAVGMGWTVVTTMVDPPGSIKRNPPPRADAPVCAPGQTQGCVGGTAAVIVAPTAPASR